MRSTLNVVALRIGACLLAYSAATHSMAATVDAVEYFHADFGHYFLTAFPDEAAKLDSGAIKGWARTGLSFRVNSTAAAELSPVCRFFSTSFAPKSSHFYTPSASECLTVKQNANWQYEADAFFVQAPDSLGNCPVGTARVFRLYNNGMGAAPNHRYTISASIRAQAIAQGWIPEGLGPEGVVFCATAGPPPIATPVGVATGSATSASIGAAGGSLIASDGTLALSIPAGALTADTVISIQPMTNYAPGKIGAAYRLTPDGQTFLKPVTLRFAYTEDDLLGTAAEFLGAAFQTAAGYWQWLGAATVDTTAQTVSVSSSHFTDISKVKGLQIRPKSKTVKTNGTASLQVRVCYVDPATLDDELASLGYDCDLDQGPPGNLSVNEWSVNHRLGGGGVFGTVVGVNTSATYTAPASVPIPNPVAVSARIHIPRQGGITLVASNITIADDSWTGMASSSGPGPVRVTAQVTWVLQSTVNNVATYTPTGTATINDFLNPCHINPLDGVIDPNMGKLVVDYNATPPTYHGDGVTQWPATVTCPPSPPANIIANALYFGGIRNGQGSVSADGTTIEGSDTAPGGVTINWKFTRDR